MASDIPVDIELVWRLEENDSPQVARFVARAGEVWASWTRLDATRGGRDNSVHLGSRWGGTPGFSVDEARLLLACLQRVLAEVDREEAEA